MVTEGASPAPASARRALLRDNVVIYEGKIASLRRFKDDASEVAQQPRLGLAGAGDAAFGDHAAGDRAELRHLEDLAHLGRRRCRTSLNVGSSRPAIAFFISSVTL